MKIKKIRVEGFGVWTDVEFHGLSEPITVFYGPNETGKTTLMQLVRSLLYGFSAERRRRYLPPVHGGTPGGTLTVDTPEGRFEITRRGDRGPAEGDVMVTAPDGTQLGEPALKPLLHGVDESIFNNVFACGLREVQELATLSDIDAARYLYDLTAGVDRVSLIDVENELVASRERLLAPSGRPSQIGRLLAERARLIESLDTSRTALARFNRLALERAELDRILSETEDQHRALIEQARLAELAVSLRDKWMERAEVASQLTALGPVAEMPADAVERLDALHRKIAARRQKLSAEEQRRRRLRGEVRALDINEVLWRHGPRIEALMAERHWISSVESQIAAAAAEADQADADIAARRAKLGLAPGGPLAAQGNASFGSLRSLRGPARALTVARRAKHEAGQAAEAAEQATRTAERELAARLSASGESDFDAALDKAGTLCSQLRRRTQLDERTAQLARHQTELTDQRHELMNRQILPVGVLIGLGATFALGTLLVLVGLLMPTSLVGSFGWALALLGLLGTGAAVGGKLLWERSAARELDAASKQLEMIELQRKQAEEERDDLDRRLPRGGGPLVNRLRAAESSLADLEELAPLDAQRQLTVREAQSARVRAAESTAQYRQAHRAWRRALRVAGLPPKLRPRQLAELTTAYKTLGELEARAAECRQQADARQRELSACMQRVAQLAADTQLAGGGNTLELLDRLSEALAEQERLVARRTELRQALRQCRLTAKRHVRRIAKLRRRRKRLLQHCGAKNAEDLRRRALAAARHGLLSRQHTALSAEITAALGNVAAEDQLARMLHNPASDAIDAHRAETATRAAGTAVRLKELYENRGRLDEQLKGMAADRGTAELQLELSTLDTQLRTAADRWRQLAVTGLLLSDIRKQFERERQPATLCEASEYLRRLTADRYTRVWTPLGERRLLVDDAEGNSLSPEVLSQGTRELLFLSLRLALVTRYAERGVELPLVLDDVMVNFDGERAKAAARVLRDFAREGHQLMMFTCHEHIVKAFKAVKVETRTLPAHAAVSRPLAIETDVDVTDDEAEAAGAATSAPSKAPSRGRAPRVERSSRRVRRPPESAPLDAGATRQSPTDDDDDAEYQVLNAEAIDASETYKGFVKEYDDSVEELEELTDADDQAEAA